MVNQRDIKYKIQNIFSKQDVFLGGEILLNTFGFSASLRNTVLKRVFSDSTQSINLMERLSLFVEESSYFRKAYLNKSIFINIEVSHLKEQRLIDSIIKTKTILARYSIYLVIEITERVNGVSFDNAREGIRLLASYDITLAADDFTLSNSEPDYRSSLIGRGVFKYVKLDISECTPQGLLSLEGGLNGERLIIERIEEKGQFDFFKHVCSFWGGQGYYFCCGNAIDL
ncbi:EAL domain-containing protein [Aliivibrio fischeri]|uniref:EAL domain-containing protein n=1 Tax=Aliivibrio fischeri TaxID=668 RepID=UPI00080E7AB9|nr:EAL domain-containing protein [Aliivibrio fischeri]OCH48161.1 hypothetical protein A6E02_08520 [Aliivibrio fischeri]